MSPPIQNRDETLRPDERWVTSIDPETGRISSVVERNWLLVPFYGVGELVSDIASGRMRTRDWVFVWVVLMIILRG